MRSPRKSRPFTRGAATAIALAATASLVLTSCGRDESAGADGPSEAIDEGKATGTIDVWAMGTEGDMLQDFSAAFEEANPDATVKVTADPLGRRAQQDRQRHRRRRGPRREPDRHHVDG